MSDLNPIVESSSRSAFPDLNRILETPHPECFPTLEESAPATEDAELPRKVREGLPPTYRMRADAHYVEQLDAPPSSLTIQLIAVQAIDSADELRRKDLTLLVESIRRHGVLEPLLVQNQDGHYRLIAGRKRLTAARICGLREVPCLVHRVDDTEARLLASAARMHASERADPEVEALAGTDADLGNALSAVASCAALLSETTPSLTRTIAADLVRAEIWRARCLLHAARVLRGGVSPVVRSIAPRDLVRLCIHSVETDARLRGIEVQTALTLAEEGTVRADEELFVYGFSGVLLTMFAMLEGVSRAHVTVAALPEGAGRIALSVSQDSVAVPHTWPDPLIESVVNRPSAYAQAIPILALRRIAQAHNARLSIHSLARGCRVSVDLPLESKRR